MRMWSRSSRIWRISRLLLFHLMRMSRTKSRRSLLKRRLRLRKSLLPARILWMNQITQNRKRTPVKADRRPILWRRRRKPPMTKVRKKQ